MNNQLEPRGKWSLRDRFLAALQGKLPRTVGVMERTGNPGIAQELMIKETTKDESGRDRGLRPTERS